MASLASSEGFVDSIQDMEDMESIEIPEMDCNLLTELLEDSEQLAICAIDSHDEACEDCSIDDIISEGCSHDDYSVESPSSTSYDFIWMEIDGHHDLSVTYRDHDMSTGWYMMDACMDEGSIIMHEYGDECMHGFLYDGECLDQALWID